MSQGYTPNLEVPINILSSGLLVVLLLVCGAGLSAQQNTGSGDLPTGIPGPLPPIPPAVINQAREELGLIEGLRTAFESMKKTFQKSQPPPPAGRNTEDEDSMFIG